jgi:hypothetical protein
MAEPTKKKRAVAYLIDLDAGFHRYVTVEGVGECRENFAQLVQGMELHPPDVVMVYKAEFLFIDTSPMWMEKFIATAQRHGITVVDTSQKREYDLRSPGDEAAFRALGAA